MTRISPSSRRLDFFAPSSWATDNAADLDLGSMTPALTANGFILQAGKSGIGYVLRASHLGGIGGQVSSGPLCSAFGVAAVTGNTVYLPCTDGLSRLIAINGAGRKTGSITLGSTPTRFATPAQEGNKVFVGTTMGIVAIWVG